MTGVEFFSSGYTGKFIPKILNEFYLFDKRNSANCPGSPLTIDLYREAAQFITGLALAGDEFGLQQANVLASLESLFIPGSRTPEEILILFGPIFEPLKTATAPIQLTLPPDSALLMKAFRLEPGCYKQIAMYYGGFMRAMIDGFVNAAGITNHQINYVTTNVSYIDLNHIVKAAALSVAVDGFVSENATETISTSILAGLTSNDDLSNLEVINVMVAEAVNVASSALLAHSIDGVFRSVGLDGLDVAGDLASLILE